MSNILVHDAHHNAMVGDYAFIIIDAIITHGNRNAPFALRNFIGHSLAYSGMTKTSYWKTLPDTCIIKGVNVWAGGFNGYPSNWQWTPQGCGNYNYAFRDSLQLLSPCQ